MDIRYTHRKDKKAIFERTNPTGLYLPVEADYPKVYMPCALRHASRWKKPEIYGRFPKAIVQ